MTYKINETKSENTNTGSFLWSLLFVAAALGAVYMIMPSQTNSNNADFNPRTPPPNQKVKDYDKADCSGISYISSDQWKKIFAFCTAKNFFTLFAVIYVVLLIVAQIKLGRHILAMIFFVALLYFLMTKLNILERLLALFPEARKSDDNTTDCIAYCRQLLENSRFRLSVSFVITIFLAVSTYTILKPDITDNTNTKNVGSSNSVQVSSSQPPKPAGNENTDKSSIEKTPNTIYTLGITLEELQARFITVSKELGTALNMSNIKISSYKNLRGFDSNIAIGLTLGGDINEDGSIRYVDIVAESDYDTKEIPLICNTLIKTISPELSLTQIEEISEKLDVSNPKRTKREAIVLNGKEYSYAALPLGFIFSICNANDVKNSVSPINN